MNGYESIYVKMVNDIKSITYKNVLRRVHELYKFRVIEPIEGNFKHGAINYRLTGRGLIYLFSTGTISVNMDEVILSYPDNILFKDLVYNCFEISTLRKRTDILERFLSNYVETCCQIMASYLFFFKMNTDSMYAQLRWQKRSLILNLATVKDDVIDWPVGYNIDDKKRENDRQKTLEVLAKDQKFMAILKEYGEEFIRCYNTLIALSKT